MEKLKKIMPLKLHHQKQVFQQLDETTYAIIYGSLLIAAVQGAAGALGFFIFGVSSPVAWGVMMAIFALLPFIGTAIIWLPVTAVMIVQGLSTNSPNITLKGIGLLLYCAIIVSSMDNVLKPHIIGKKARIHPVLVLLGVLGGLAFFGFVGFIIGPLILAVFMTFLDIYEKEKLAGNGLKQ
jgi:predicted PurR-regulated permease PerM